MWKKIVVLVFALLVSVTLGKAYMDYSMQAQSQSSKYYGVGDVFAETGKSTFNMGGIEWSIIYADLNAGTGVIMSEYLGGNVQPNSVSSTLNSYANQYNLTRFDDIGEQVINKNKNQVSTLSLMNQSIYDKITNMESKIGRAHF